MNKDYFRSKLESIAENSIKNQSNSMEQLSLKLESDRNIQNIMSLVIKLTELHVERHPTENPVIRLYARLTEHSNYRSAFHLYVGSFKDCHYPTEDKIVSEQMRLEMKNILGEGLIINSADYRQALDNYGYSTNETKYLSAENKDYFGIDSIYPLIKEIRKVK